MSSTITNVSHVGEYWLELSFADGLKSVVDFKSRVLARGGIWLPLRDVEYFKRVRIDAELQSLVWPNGVDICPEVLYALAVGKPLPDAHVDGSATVKN